MTASERAKQLLVAYGNAWLTCGRSPSRATVTTTILTADALLAYVAALEAVADQARMELRRYPDDPALHSIRSALSVAALDRPEDGEHGDN